MEVLATAEFPRNIDVSVSAEWVEGGENFPYGILFMRSDAGMYGYSITADGRYVVSRWDETLGIPTAIVDWAFSSSINTKGRNAMRVVTQGPLISIYINGQLLDQVNDATLTGGLVGLHVGGLQEVAFDNLIVTDLGEPQPLLKMVGSGSHHGTQQQAASETRGP